MAAEQPGRSSLRNLARPAVVVVLLVGVLLIVPRMPITAETIVFAALLAYAINPVVRALSKKMGRGAAIAVVFVGLLVAMIATALIVIPNVVGQLQNLVANSGDYIAAAQSWVTREIAAINQKLGGHLWAGQTTNLSGQVLSSVSNFLENNLGQVGGAVISTIGTLVVIFTAIILSYYFLANADALRASFLSFFPSRSQAGALRFTEEVERAFSGYLGGQLILNLFCGVVTFLVLWILHANFALLVGVLTGLLYSIPYLGEPSAMLFGALFGLSQSWQTALWSVVTILVVTRISDTFLVPRVMSKTVGLSPMGIMIAVLAGGELFKLWGLLLAIPVAALIKVIWTVWLQPWLVGKPSTNSAQDSYGGHVDASGS